MPKLTDWMRERAVQSSTAPAAKPLQHVWYVVDGMAVHLDGRDLPAPCARCKGMSQFFCAFPVIEGVPCAAPLCAACAKPIGNNKYLCPIHVKQLENRKGSLL